MQNSKLVDHRAVREDPALPNNVQDSVQGRERGHCIQKPLLPQPERGQYAQQGNGEVELVESGLGHGMGEVAGCNNKAGD